MKLFLRYQLSGTVLVSWWLLFLYYADKSKFCEIQEFILSKNILGVVFGALALYPLGAFVHQVSVLLKNYLIGRYFFESFNDFPHVEVKVVLNNGKRKLDFDRCKFLFEKLSDLNSFFYVRYDMGFVAPLMAFLGTIIFVEVPGFDLVWVVILLVWSAGLLIYMGRLAQEREFLQAALMRKYVSKNYARRIGESEEKKDKVYSPFYFYALHAFVVLFMVCLPWFS